MTAISVPLRPLLRVPAVRLGADAIIALALLLAACLIRLPHFGDPAYMIDEQFYLVAGDGLIHGHLPYVEIWDRKPIGLFLIYAVAAAFGGGAILAYQLLATLSTAATAYVIARIARPMAGGGGIVAGLLYLLYIEIAEGGGGQSPVFYTLPVAGAVLAVLGAGAATDDRVFRRQAVMAMALIGVAIQIKYTVLFEGLFLGLVLAGWSLARLPTVSALRRIALLAGIALTPTLLAFAFYAAIGEGRAFWFANFVSIFLRGAAPPGEIHYRTEMVLLRLTPLTICIAASLYQLKDRHEPAARRWQLVLLGWCAASLVGIFAVGTLYSHYILPAFAPFAAAAAPIFRRRPSGPVLAVIAAWLPAATLHYPDVARTAHHREQIAALTALIPAGVDRQCLQMFDGPPILYWTTHACTLSRYVFPDHLSAANEARAIGVDPAAELARLLARRPLAITIGDSDVRAPNARTFALMRATLARDYRLAGAAPFDGRAIAVWVRR